MWKQALAITAAIFLGFSCRSRESASDLTRVVTRDQAEWQKIAPTEFELDAPPYERSSAFKKDFEILHIQQNSRSDADCALANSQAKPTFAAFFGPNSKVLTSKEYASVAPLMTRVTEFSESIADHFKETFGRARPYNVDGTLKPCAAKPSGNHSYPSSHATAATTDACILAEIFPDKAAELIKYGKHLGDLRYIAGVHHPSDVLAGQKLGQEICKRLLADPNFKREIKSN